VRRLKGPGRPVNTVADRMAVLAGLAAVDWGVPFSEDTPERLICRVLPQVLVKGGDWRLEQIAGGDCVRRAGGEVRALPFVEGRSTSGLIAAIRATGAPGETGARLIPPDRLVDDTRPGSEASALSVRLAATSSTPGSSEVINSSVPMPF
jgi:hypothetical protein